MPEIGAIRDAGRHYHARLDFLSIHNDNVLEPVVSHPEVGHSATRRQPRQHAEQMSSEVRRLHPGLSLRMVVQVLGEEAGRRRTATTAVAIVHHPDVGEGGLLGPPPDP